MHDFEEQFLEANPAALQLLGYQPEDVVLPGGTNGDALARQLTMLHPGLPVLYVSGYAQDAIVHDGRLDEGVNFLAKPFTSQALTAMVRMLLSEGGRGEAHR